MLCVMKYNMVHDSHWWISFWAWGKPMAWYTIFRHAYATIVIYTYVYAAHFI